MIYAKARKQAFFRTDQPATENNEPVRGTLSIFFTVRITHWLVTCHIARETQDFASLQADATAII